MSEQNKEKNMMTIIAQDGTEEEVEVIIAFKFKDTNKEYIIYTKNLIFKQYSSIIWLYIFGGGQYAGAQ